MRIKDVNLGIQMAPPEATGSRSSDCNMRNSLSRCNGVKVVRAEEAKELSHR